MSPRDPRIIANRATTIAGEAVYCADHGLEHPAPRHKPVMPKPKKGKRRARHK